MTDAGEGADAIAADDAGGSSLGRRVGETAGGQEAFGVGSEGPSGAEEGSEIAADDAGASAAIERAGRTEQRGG